VAGYRCTSCGEWHPELPLEGREREPTEHPLAVQQRDGITLAAVQRFAEQLLHGG
jgi:hypothetical protein